MATPDPTSPTPPGFARLKPCRHGLMLFNANDVYIGRSLELYGEYSEGEADVFRQILRPGSVVLEIGANIGAHTVGLARHVGPRGRVVALEPQRLAFQMLCANLALNGLTNVWTIQSAAGESPGHIAVPTLDPNAPNNFGGLSLAADASPTPPQSHDRVPLIRADSLDLPDCRLIKLDVEGMELAALKGCTSLIERFGPVLYVENDRPDRSPALVRYIDSLGYDIYWHTPPLFNANNFRGVARNVFGNVVSLNMLCVQRSATSKIDGLPRVDVPPAT